MAVGILRRSTIVATVAVIALGGSAIADRTTAQTPEFEAATATRSAEQTEVADLRATISWYETEIAVLTNPKQTPTPVPTATLFSPGAVGEIMRVGDDWEVRVIGMTMSPTWKQVVADGQFARVQLEITNLSETRDRFPYADLLLRDDSGRVFVPDRDVGFDLEAGWIDRYDPNIPSEGFIVFDVASDAVGPFILESSTDPAFRVLVPVEIPG